ncbi:U-box domain-containing protein 21-like [Durio zibethinus]|uniref:U-box domain-containing protein n=1 Tax=Durio zibethinus TaxID=66656 RepID=A0A6P6BF18_DURZI|nr:U-box domain-containing protein 21-like [Durio zibethinus]
MMISSWKRRRAARRAGKLEQKRNENGEMELTIPRDFRCPISLDLMKDPVTLSTGITYDRENIEKWIEAGNFTCPITNQVLRSFELIPNHMIRKRIQDWCVENQSYGVERIPTPRVPVSSMDVLEILSKINATCKKQDGEGCRDLVVKIKSLAKESERNKRCIVTNGAGSVLSEALEAFSRAPFDENVEVLEEILSALTIMFPFDEEAKGFLGSSSAMHCLIWFLSSGDLSGRRNAVLALRELVSSSDQRKVNELSEMEGAIEALFKLIKDPICPTSTKASLTVIYHIITSPSTNEKQVAKLVNLGLVSLLLETLVETERGMSEKALGVLDGICNSEEGREMAYNNALSMPVLVKKILRVSNLATDFSVSILWKLCKNERREDGGVLVEALQVGAFQKLLLLLQLGCVDKTKENVSELLKLLNLHRNKIECVDPMDNFKDLKRPF